MPNIDYLVWESGRKQKYRTFDSNKGSFWVIKQPQLKKRLLSKYQATSNHVKAIISKKSDGN